MKSSEVCDLAINIVAWNYGQVTYRMNSTEIPWDNAYNNMTWYVDAWRSDCLGFLRAVLCGWHADKQAYAGGADTSYGCYSENNWGFDEMRFVSSCTETSYDFTLLSQPCSLLYKEEPFRHVGLYVGEFQLDGKTYNTCEVTTSYGDDVYLGGGKPAWVDPDGTRRPYKGASSNAQKWLLWGTFNLNGVDYGLTEYDGGATGATGFGSALSQSEVEFYWDTLNDLTFDYVQGIAEKIHGMSADVFTVMAGWGWGEGYSFIPPVGDQDPDVYMAYLCDCCPVNYFEGWGIDTGYQMAAAIAGGDHSGHYSYENMTARGLDLKANETSSAGQNELRALLLALLNPEQRAWYCSGYPQPGDDIVYQRQYAGPGMIYSFNDPDSKVDYDITGSGIRGGRPDPSYTPVGRRFFYSWLRPWQNYTQYRNMVFRRK